MTDSSSQPHPLRVNLCQHEGGTGCPNDDSGRHYFAHIDPHRDGRICIDCGEPEVGH